LESERFGFFGHYFVVLYMNESFCAFLFMTKSAREKKRETRFFFFLPSLCVLTRLKSLFFFLAFGRRFFFFFRKTSGLRGVAKAVSS